MNGAKVGAAVGLVGGLLFVVLNGPVLPVPWPTVVIAAGVVLFLFTIRTVLRTPPDPDSYRPDERQMQAFWITLGLEAAAIFGGAFVIVRVLDRPDASLPWISLVLGVHWLVFHRVFGEPVFLWLGWLTLTCGVIGMLAALTQIGPPASATVVSGLLTGAVMLIVVNVDARRRRRALTGG